MRTVALRRGVCSIREAPDSPEPLPHQMLVELLAVGMCGSDLSAWLRTEALHRWSQVSSGAVSIVGGKL